MPDPSRGDYRMDPATARRRPRTKEATSAFKTTLGIALAIVLVLAALVGVAAIFLMST